MPLLADNRFFRPLPGVTIATAIAMAILVGLGLWQLERLQWKLALIARIHERMAAPAEMVPAMSDWPALDTAKLEYHHLSLTGRFENSREFDYFDHDEKDGAGFDIVTPFMLDGGGIVLVDRGFVPEAMKDRATRMAGEIEGETTVTGVARAPQSRGPFTPPDNPETNYWYTRDPAAMAKAAGLSGVAPFYVEADATPNVGGWPKGGRTHVDIRNEHFQYALTWFGLALALLVIYIDYHHKNGRIGRRE